MQAGGTAFRQNRTIQKETAMKSSVLREDLLHIIHSESDWEIFRNRTFFITGATGLIGSFLVDVIMEKNKTEGLNCRIYALTRNTERAKVRFSRHADDPRLIFVPYDVKDPLEKDEPRSIRYVLHLASNTHPLQYAADPIGTITTNIIGLQHMLEFAAAHDTLRFAFASSNEIYGENRGDTELFDEQYCGYIDCNTMRAGYPESKRCG